MLIRIVAALVFALVLSAGQRAEARTPEEILQQDYHFTQEQINQLKKGPRKLRMPVERRFAPRTAAGCPLPFILQNGTIPDATQVMADFYALQACVGGGGGGGGTPINLGLTVPPELTVTGSPYTGGSGVFAIGKAAENPSTVWAGPAAGSPQPPTFRQLACADLAGGCGTPAATFTCSSVPGSCPLSVPMFWPGIPPANQVVRIAFSDAVTCPAGLALSEGAAKTAATGTPVVGIYQSVGGTGTPTLVGTATFTGATPAFAAAATINFAVGDVIQYQFPASPDATMADVSLTLHCSRTTGTSIGAPPVVQNVTLCGAAGNGVTDDTVAIQNCINGLPSQGGTVVFPQGLVFKTTATLTIGNGSSSAASTTGGVLLQGQGVNGSRPQINYTGSGVAIAINGPLNGWGLQNLGINCTSSSGTTAIEPISASYGDSSDLVISGCKTAILSTTVTSLPGGVTIANSMHNAYRNLLITIPDVSGATAILLTGHTVADTDYNIISNTIVFCSGATNPTNALVLQAAETTIVEDFHVVCGATTAPFTFDYTVFSGWPDGNTLIDVDPGPNFNPQFQNVGAPGGLAQPNFLIALTQTNGGVYPSPPLANLSTDHGPQTVTNTNLVNPSVTVNSQTCTLGSSCTIPGIASGANPTAKVGTAAVNGSAGTFLRSDGAPAIDLTMSPTWTGVHAFGEVHGTTTTVTLTSNNYNAVVGDCGTTKLLPTGTTPTVTLPNINPASGSCTIVFITTAAKSYLFNAASGGSKQNSQGFYNTRGTAAGDTVVVTLITPSVSAAAWNVSGDVTS